jgi:hypothetical protein
MIQKIIINNEMKDSGLDFCNPYQIQNGPIVKIEYGINILDEAALELKVIPTIPVAITTKNS